MAENFANEYETTLSAGIGAADTSITVASATGAPSANFRIRIDNEYLLVTNVSGTTFTVTRAVEGSTAASHSSGATVTHVLTAEGLTNLQTLAGQALDLGALSLATRRAAANTEDDHFDGTSLDAKWLSYTGYDATIDLTTLPGWARFSAGGAKLQAVPAGDWTMECEALCPTLATATHSYVGLVTTSGTDSAASYRTVWEFGMNNSLTSYRFVTERFLNGAFNASINSLTIAFPITVPWFIRVVKSSTTYHFEVSGNGKTWQRIHSNSSLGYTPTHFGIEGRSADSYINYFLRY